VHNFDETGFQMGIAVSSRLVIGPERRAWPELVQASKEGFLLAVKDAYDRVFAEANCKAAFEAS
jgi:hypothetical protein